MKNVFLSRLYFTSILWIILVGLSGCFKQVSENYGEEETIVENAALAVQEADDALEIAYQVEAIQKTFSGGRLAAVQTCGEIFDDPSDKILTVNYDTICQGAFGRIRFGKIIVHYTNLADSLSDKTLTFENYTVNGRKISGTISLHDISFLVSPPDPPLQMATRTLTDFKVEFVNGTSVTLNGNHNRQWLSGRADSIITNNVYRYEGSIGGVTSNGRSFQQDVSTPVIANFYCSVQGFFARTRGVAELSKLDGYPDRKRTVDFGDGTCDNSITVETFRRTYGVLAN